MAPQTDSITEERTSVKNTKILDVERPFEYDELFFSVTDKKSKILFANEVFIRISGYKTDEIIGKLHKVIRHPDMPRSVFKIFWDHLNESKPVAAYVKNRAKDGSYYWVMALAYPCEAGYLSIRLKPGSELFSEVKAIYKKVLTFEKEKEAELGKRRGMNEAEEYLNSILNEHGFDSYDDFMWKALETEMRNREKELDKEKIQSVLLDGDVPPAQIELQNLLGNLFTRLESIERLQEVLIENSNYMLELARSIFKLSLNAQIGASKLSNDYSISTIAQNMGKQSQKGEVELNQIQDIVKDLNKLLIGLNFDIISSKLQVEMTNNFLLEMSSDDEGDAFITNQLLGIEEAEKILVNGYKDRMDSIIEGIAELPKNLRGLRTQIIKIERFLHVLRYIKTTGKIEIAKMGENAKTFVTTFEDLIQEVDDAQDKLDKLSDIIFDNEQTVDQYLVIKNRLNKLNLS
ncbi:PAS domain-containing protein [Gracilimonas sp. Q87]|uniref:PAS domain-containing protein n=1 Tax=Gracilimonas sp. Q87 TaxID=3384766 RepID=UPI003983E64B